MKPRPDTSDFFPVTEYEEKWCSRLWLEWRATQKHEILCELPRPARGPDRLFVDASGNTIGVEITRLLNSSERERENVALRFLRADVFPLVNRAQLPGYVSVGITALEVPQRDKEELAAKLAREIEENASALGVGQSTSCAVAHGQGRVAIHVMCLSASVQDLDIDAITDSSWEGAEFEAALVDAAIRKKAAKGQLAGHGISWRILLLHDRLPGVREANAHQAVAALPDEVLCQFDEIFLIDTYSPGRCIRCWPAAKLLS